MLVPDLKRPPRSGAEQQSGPARTAPLHSPQDRLQEATGLAEAIDLNVVDSMLVPVANPRPATLFGTGKVDELKALIAAHDIALVIIDHPVSPIQQRNLERAWNAKVLDRTGLILEIFGRRARTKEGRLQVELAHLSYQKSRLVRTWTHLERQRGGYGFLGGPGEAQIELDRRMIDERIIAIRKDLEVVVRTRELHRQGRRRVPYPVVAIVGYTNAGKSTLFNRITGAGVFAKHQLFATLDPTMREVRLKSGRRIILSDTVGFISDLPTMLVAAFRATLEEVIEADLILHVRDISHPETDSQARDVEAVLADLGIDTLERRRRHPRGVEQDRPVEPGDARGSDERRALAGAAAGARLGDDGRGDRGAARRHRSTPRTRRRRRRAGHSRARGRLHQLAVRGSRGHLAGGARQRRRASQGARCQREERAASGPSPPRRRRLDAGLNGPLRHVHIA